MEDDINSLYNEIKAFLMRNGPSLMVDIASYIKKDTMQTGAILDYFVGRGMLSKTSRKYGFSSIYFLQEQKDLALSKLYEILNSNEKAIVNKFKERKVIDAEELMPAERYLIQNLSDFIKKLTAVDSETNQKKELFAYYNIPNENIKQIINEKQTQVKKRERTQAQKQSVTVEKSVQGNIENMLSASGFESPIKLEKNIFIAKYGQYKVNVIVGVYPKKKPNKSDIAKVAGYATKNRTIAFILTNTVNLTHDYGNLINIIQIQ